MEMLCNDRALLDAFRLGEHRALEQVYLGYAKELFGFLQGGFSFSSEGKRFRFSGYTVTWQLEEAVQDVFLRAFSPEARQAYDGIRPFKGYLFTIAKNRVMDLYRQHRLDNMDFREIGDIAESEFLTGEECKTPEQLAMEIDLKDQVELFISSLDTDFQQFYHVRFSDGKSLEEVCKQLELTDYRAKQMERWIKKTFFTHMQRQGYFAGYTYRDRGVERLIVTMLLTLGSGC